MLRAQSHWPLTKAREGREGERPRAETPFLLAHTRRCTHDSHTVRSAAGLLNCVCSTPQVLIRYTVVLRVRIHLSVHTVSLYRTRADGEIDVEVLDFELLASITGHTRAHCTLYGREIIELIGIYARDESRRERRDQRERRRRDTCGVHRVRHAA